MLLLFLVYLNTGGVVKGYRVSNIVWYLSKNYIYIYTYIKSFSLGFISIYTCY